MVLVSNNLDQEGYCSPFSGSYPFFTANHFVASVIRSRTRVSVGSGNRAFMTRIWPKNMAYRNIKCQPSRCCVSHQEICVGFKVPLAVLGLDERDERDERDDVLPEQTEKLLCEFAGADMGGGTKLL